MTAFSSVPHLPGQSMEMGAEPGGLLSPVCCMFTRDDQEVSDWVELSMERGFGYRNSMPCKGMSGGVYRLPVKFGAAKPMSKWKPMTNFSAVSNLPIWLYME